MKISKNRLEKIQNFQAELFSRAHNDSNFKQELVGSPEESLKKYFGLELSKGTGLNIVVEDQSNPNMMYLNIPRKLDLNNLELNDEQLDLVSGGENTSIFFDLGYWAYNNPGEAALLLVDPLGLFH